MAFIAGSLKAQLKNVMKKEIRTKKAQNRCPQCCSASYAENNYQNSNLCKKTPDPIQSFHRLGQRYVPELLEDDQNTW